MPVMSKDVRQPLIAQIDVRQVADSLHDVRAWLREEHVGFAGAVRSNYDDGGMKHHHRVVQ